MLSASRQFESACAIIASLRAAGYEAYLAGGCVRDLLLGREPSDYDVATSATPDVVLVMFPRTFAVGAHFGVVLVATEVQGADAGGEKPDFVLTEVATFRSDGAYSDGRHPDEVRYTLSAEEDVRRRDFTINGLLLDAADHALVAAANDVLARHYRTFWHTVAAAVRGRDGRVWTGLHLGTTVGRLSVCAEAVAIGRAIMDGDGSIECAVAVRHPKPEELDRELAVVAPCGACRELILDYSPDALVILKRPEGLLKLPVRALLPEPYRR